MKPARNFKTYASYKLAGYSRLMSLAGKLDDKTADAILKDIKQSRRTKW